MSTAITPRLDTKQAAEYLRLGESTLRSYRANGAGPVHYQIGRRYFYELVELDQWIDAQRLATAKGGAEILLSPLAGVHEWVGSPERTAKANAWLVREGSNFQYDGERALAPIKLTRAKAGVLTPRSATPEECMAKVLAEGGPFWSVDTDGGIVCAKAKNLSDLMPWLQEFSIEFEKALAELEAANS